jgi:hypothetical protein
MKKVIQNCNAFLSCTRVSEEGSKSFGLISHPTTFGVWYVVVNFNLQAAGF